MVKECEVLPNLRERGPYMYFFSKFDKATSFNSEILAVQNYLLKKINRENVLTLPAPHQKYIPEVGVC